MHEYAAPAFSGPLCPLNCFQPPTIPGVRCAIGDEQGEYIVRIVQSNGTVVGGRQQGPVSRLRCESAIGG